MDIIFLLIGVSLTVALGFLAAFLWATKSGQYEDTYTPGIRVLFDDDDEAYRPSGGAVDEPRAPGTLPAPAPR